MEKAPSPEEAKSEHYGSQMEWEASDLVFEIPMAPFFILAVFFETFF